MPPYPGLWNQAQDLAMQELQGYLGSVTKASRRETRKGNRFIRNLAHSFADELRNISGGMGQVYGQAQAEQQAGDAAIANFLQGGGAQLGNQLAQQLSFAPQETIDQFAGGQATQGQALANVGAGFAGINQKAFTDSRASNMAFGKALPGIAALSGIQSAGAFQSQQADALRAQRDQILSQAPGLAASLYSSFASQRQQQQAMRQQERFHSEEMEQRRLEAGVTQTGEDTKRLDAANALAHDEILSLTTGIGGAPLPGGQRPSYENVHGRVAAIYRQAFQGRSDSWVNAQVDQAMRMFGYVPDNGMSGQAAQLLSGIFGSGGGQGSSYGRGGVGSSSPGARPGASSYGGRLGQGYASGMGGSYASGMGTRWGR
jgi:hypothetical protein